MKRFTYVITDEGEEELVFEEITDLKGRLLYYKDYQADPVSEKICEYSSTGLLVKETEIAEGMELSRAEYLYDNRNQNIQRNLLIGGELYETITKENNGNDFVETKYIEGEETIKKIISRTGLNSTIKFYEGEKLLENHINEFDLDTNVYTTKIYNSKNELFKTRKETFNEFGFPAKIEEFNKKNELLKQTLYEWKGFLILNEIHNNSYLISNEYDSNNNLIKKETKTLTGALTDFHYMLYDEKNRLVEESGVNNGSFEAVYGNYLNGNHFNFRHRYED